MLISDANAIQEYVIHGAVENRKGAALSCLNAGLGMDITSNCYGEHAKELIESRDMSGEASSRADISLPEIQQVLLKNIIKRGKKLVVVLMNGRQLALSWEDKNVNAIVEGWHLGTEMGNAISDVLFGDFNPCGKLTNLM